MVVADAGAGRVEGGVNSHWNKYWSRIRAHDYDGAVAEALRGGPPGDVGGIDRRFYVEHMVWNHIDADKHDPRRTPRASVMQ